MEHISKNIMISDLIFPINCHNKYDFDKMSNGQINKIIMEYLNKNNNTVTETNELINLDNSEITKLVLLAALIRLNDKENELIDLRIKYDLICEEIIKINRIDKSIANDHKKYEMVLRAFIIS